MLCTCENFFDTPLTKINKTGIIPYTAGEEACFPNHFWGAGVRSRYLIHYVISGKGVFYCGTNKYTLKKGQIFVIFPDTIVKYQADDVEPWHYAWVSFNGDEAKELLKKLDITIHNPVVTVKNGTAILNVLRKMPKKYSSNIGENLRFTALMYEFMSYLYTSYDREESNQNKYFSAAVRYINTYFYEDISVLDVAEFVGISRKYLFALFKNAIGKSPQDYIIEYRISKACEFLKNEDLSIGGVAYSVGYKDPLTFSKMFKSKMGVSPSEYRNSLVE